MSIALAAPEFLASFAQRYTAAWCSQQPERVAGHFSSAGSLRINNGTPAVGRQAIADVARSFMAAFPDLTVTLDRLVTRQDGTEYHWTLTGTNSGPGGAGRHVRISGYEIWRMGRDGLIEESQGYFDTALYQHQLEHGAQE